MNVQEPAPGAELRSLKRPWWRMWFRRSGGTRTFQAVMPNRPTLLRAAVEPYGLEISLLDDGRFELTWTDWEQECGHGLDFDDLESAQRAALVVIGARWIVWCDLRGIESD